MDDYEQPNPENAAQEQAAHEPEAYFVSREREMHFRQPKRIIEAYRLEDVTGALDEVNRAIEAGEYAAGFVAYEAAPAFDSVLQTHAPGEFPLLWFGIFAPPEQSLPKQGASQPYTVGEWEAMVSADDYRSAVGAIRDRIGAGETYQVNYTFPLRAQFSGDALAWFRNLCVAQRADYCAYIDTGRFKVLSVSPELFFSLDEETLTVRPMKGTRARGLWPEADEEASRELAESEKDRAENVMIVDLMRNDLGRIAEPGSVEVTRLHDVERYETVWQMTSTVTCKTQAGLPAIFNALFPSGSVTGAPKVHTMEIIRGAEPYPRGAYCGTIGWAAPKRRAEFNVAIRTVTVDEERGEARYSVGGGVTWDSTAEAEYAECFAKAALLSHCNGDFSLLETLYYDGEFYLLDRHLERLESSARYFGFPAQGDRIKADLFSRAKAWPVSERSPLRVRLLLSRSGSLHVEANATAPSGVVFLGYARDAVDTSNVFLYHKTTRREFYETALCTRPDCDDVLLWNERGEITESARANVVLDMDGKRLTPPVSSGLLPGVMRAEMLAQGVIEEAVLTKEDVERARNIWLINSVRKWMPVVWRGERPAS